ncbi:hypothetical protein [uncultured Dysosmobacter sp.]|uniref:hypothetical protein n=1 Tax=uncultured Dysosmobacter sp. TaxID=2591384 RepID=UPI00261FAAD2|nr:hypothetical protein [uncultured Dysosmobacter sp.]
MEISEQEIAEEFGVELPQPEGQEQPQETPQEPPREDGGEPENGPDTQEPEGQEPEDTETPETQDPAAPPEMSAGEWRQWAAEQRARAEQDWAAAEQARQDRLFTELFAGQVSPYTGRPITTEAEYRAWKAERDRAQQTEQLQKAGIDPASIKGIVDQELAPMREKLQQAELAAMQERARAVNAKAQEAISASLRNISAMDPSVKSLEDIAALPTAARFNELVQKGVGLEDAFYLANRQAIDTRRAAAAKAAALNGAANRRHLDPVRDGSGKLPVEVPAEQAELFREMMPNASDEEIRTAYAAYLKDIKKERKV